MLKVIKKLLERNLFTIAVSITFLIAYLSLAKINQGSSPVKNVDKLEHSFAYFVLAISWFYAFYKKNGKDFFKLKIAIALFFYGVLIEGLQMCLTTYRTGDFFDLIANSSGVILAFILFDTVRKKINIFLNESL